MSHYLKYFDPMEYRDDSPASYLLASGYAVGTYMASNWLLEQYLYSPI